MLFRSPFITNFARFDSLTSIPFDLQSLTLANPARAAWFAGNGNSFFGLEFARTTIVHYLRPDTIRLERLVPFVRFGPPATDRGSYPLEAITASSSLTNSAPILVALAGIGIVLMIQRRTATWIALTTGALLAAIPTLTIAFIANRYLVDMLPLIAVPSAVAITLLRAPSHGVVHTGLRVLAIALVADRKSTRLNSSH